MRVHLGSDHAGFELKNRLVVALTARGHDVIDHGADAYDAEDDYPQFCLETGEAVVQEPGSLGIVIGGSGNGEQVAANKVAGVRAALGWSTETVGLARLHNDANVLAIGARMHGTDDAIGFAETFLSTAFTEEERHRRRIAQLASYERTRQIPVSGDFPVASDAEASAAAADA
jgi:ribose 5-phosphate isomerase B